MNLNEYALKVSNSDDISVHQSIITEVLKTREPRRVKAKSKLVCHLSSAPFANIADEESFRQPFKALRFEDHARCGPRCQAVKERSVLKENCPCVKGADQICYLEVIRGMGSIEGLAHENQEEICFCPDQSNILSEKYSARMRKATGFTSWRSIDTVDGIVKALQVTHWAKSKEAKKLRIMFWVREACNRYDLMFVKSQIAQSIYSVNSVILMALFSNPEGLGSRWKIAKRTAQVFEDCFYSYLKKRKYGEDGGELHRFHPVLMLKAFHGEVTKWCNSAVSFEKRVSWGQLDYLEESNLKDWIADIIDPMLAEAHIATVDTGKDFTLSVRWIAWTQVLAQTRAVSYLPEAVKIQKREKFRKTISRPLEVLTKEERKFEFQLIFDSLSRAGLIRDGLADLESEHFLAMEERAKLNACIEANVFDGGKMEAGRFLLHSALKYKWEIQVFNLYTGEEEKSYFVDGSRGSHQKDLFWISIGILLRWVSKKKGRLKGNAELKVWESFEGTDSLFVAAIVHIGEQAKERNLIKSSAPLTWVFGPGSKVLASYLAKDKRHTTGLTGSADAWNLDKRISPFSPEAHFMYNREFCEPTKADVLGFQIDLQESTDFARRECALTHLNALIRYSGFPAWYGRLILIAYRQEMEVHEVIVSDEGFNEETRDYKGKISEGIMMGLEPTKVALHLAHFRADEYARNVLKSKNILVKRSGNDAIAAKLQENLEYPSNPQVS